METFPRSYIRAMRGFFKPADASFALAGKGLNSGKRKALLDLNIENIIWSKGER